MLFSTGCKRTEEKTMVEEDKVIEKEIVEENKEIEKPEESKNEVVEEKKEDIKETKEGYLPLLQGELVTKAMNDLMKGEINFDYAESKELTKENAQALLKNDEYKKELDEICEPGYSDFYKIIQADLDNDGIKDIIVSYFSGSLGDGYQICYWGDKNGEYIRDSHGNVSSNADCEIIAYEGKNYKKKKTLNLDTKVLSGLSLELYSNKKPIQAVKLNKEKSGQYNKEFIYLNESYTELVDESINKVINYDYNDDHSVTVGTAEKEHQEKVYCDINNDGVIEEYKKRTFFATNRYMVDYIQYDNLDFKELGVDVGNLNVDLQMFWVDQYNGRNITSFLSGNDSGYILKGYDISPTEAKLVYEIIVYPEYRIEMKEMAESEIKPDWYAGN